MVEFKVLDYWLRIFKLKLSNIGLKAMNYEPSTMNYSKQ